MAKTKNADKLTLKQWWRNTKIRLSLLRIWAVKNISLFLKIALFICIILVFTGHIDENTPLLGSIFGELSTEIHLILTNNGSFAGKTIVNLLTTVGSLAVTLILFGTKAKNLALTDIKSKKIKKALLDSGVYFNQNGEMVKRVEEATKLDLNGDKKVGMNDVSITEIPNEGLISGIKRSCRELQIIFTVRINDKSDIQTMIKKAELEETKKAMEPVAIDLNNIADEAIDNKIDSITSEKRDAQQKKGFWIGIKSLFKNTKDSLSLKTLEKEMEQEEKIKANNKETEDKLLVSEELPDVTIKENEVEIINTKVEDSSENEKTVETTEGTPVQEEVVVQTVTTTTTTTTQTSSTTKTTPIDPVEAIFAQARAKRRR